MSVDIVLASGNRHKVAELRAMLAARFDALRVRGLGEFADAPEVEESADTFLGNAELKARGIATFLASLGERAHTWVLADDSGLSVDALDGAPGVYSARFAGPTAQDADNNRAMVAALEARGVDRSPAHYSCVLALCRVDQSPFGGKELHDFEGRWPVEVRIAARGNGGFGYDPHAWIDGGRGTVAELDAAQKAQRSHRGRALRALIDAWPGARDGAADS